MTIASLTNAYLTGRTIHLEGIDLATESPADVAGEIVSMYGISLAMMIVSIREMVSGEIVRLCVDFA